LRHYQSTLMPEYPVLLLCEKVVIDTFSFSLLEENEHDLYAPMAETFTALYKEGFIELVDFSQILKDNQQLLGEMLKHDLANADQWITPLKESQVAWSNFARRFDSDLITRPQEDIPESSLHFMPLEGDDYYEANLDLLANALSGKAGRKARRHLKNILTRYLPYINSNIVLSNSLGIGLHDWSDFLPFYRHKFLSVGREDIEGVQQTSAIEKLFEVAFPEFTVDNPTQLLRILQDKRILDLRQLVNEAVEGRAEFDQEFARRILLEVINVEKQVAKYRGIASYLTLPLDLLLDFLPWVGTLASKGLEETIGLGIERKLKQKYRWFYLLSDAAEQQHYDYITTTFP
jgi:hypothetical protein